MSDIITLEDVDPAKFWSRVDVRAEGECWVWTGPRLKAAPEDYGMVIVTRGRGSGPMHRRTFMAHRIAYHFVIGPVPAGLSVCHRCDHAPCCNPRHLFVGTTADNAHDAMVNGRHAHGEDHPAAKLTTAYVLEIKALHEHRVASMREIAEVYGVSLCLVNNIVHGRAWKHLSEKEVAP